MKTILLWGLPSDRPLALVRQALDDMGASYVFIDQRDELELEAELRIDEAIGGYINSQNRRINLEDVYSAYFRAHDFRRIPRFKAAGEGNDVWTKVMNIEDFLSTWSDITPALVINRTSAMCANGSKPFQSRWIQSLGFNVPETVITSDPEVAVAFVELHGEVIYKSISGIRSIVSKVSLADRQRLQDVTWCPTQFQAYVPGIDVRVHVIGDQVFPCQIQSPVTDYRYPGQGRTAERPTLTPIELPDAVRSKCIQMTKSMGLVTAGIDLRQTPADLWFCFEVNPSPGFSYYEDETGQPISRAIAELLKP